MSDNFAENPRERPGGGLPDRWFLVYCQPNRETLAAAELANQGFSTFLPRLRRTVRHARRFREKLSPLFPRYLFVRLTAAAPWRSINGTRGVVRIVQYGALPEPVPVGIVEALMAQVDEEGLLASVDSLSTGQRVEVTSGPLAGLKGDLAVLDPDGRVELLLHFMGASRKLTVKRPGAGLTQAG